MLNEICVMGRMVKDVELRYTQNEKAVANFTLACERDRAVNGERQTDFIDCVAWDKGAEFVSKYFHKGSMAVVKGRLQSRKWEDRDGNKRINFEVMTESIYFGESARDGDRH